MSSTSPLINKQGNRRRLLQSSSNILTMKLNFFHLLLLALVPYCLGETTDVGELHEYNYDTDHKVSFTTTDSPYVKNSKRVIITEKEVDEDTTNCYEEDRKYAPMVLRSEWNQERKDAIIVTAPVEFVVIRDGGQRCFSKTVCLNNLKSEIIEGLIAVCDLRENFYVGNNGITYEGRGWGIAPYWYLNGIREKSITVKFMGSHHSQLPSGSVMRAFKSTLVMGVWTGKLSPNYKILSIRQFTNKESYIGEELHQNVMTWDGWVNDTVPSSRWEYQSSEFLNFVFRRAWNANEALQNFESTESPVEYVLLNNDHNRCHSRQECMSQIQHIQNRQKENFGDVFDNFYIGEDGNVYEGRGWDVLPHWHVEGFRKSYVSVTILGSFQSELPSDKAISAFKELIATALELNKISPHFRLTSLRSIYNDSVFLGDALERYTQKWTPWWKELDTMKAEERIEAKYVPLITRSGYYAHRNQDLTTVQSIYHTRLPVHYIFINDGGKSCFNVNDCTKNMISEMDSYKHNYGDLIDNFYIGGDGNIYEGRGWKNSPPVYLKHLNNSYITVRFFGEFQSTKPNTLALLALQSLIKLGIELEKISPSYQIYSYRHIYNESSFLGDALSEYAEGLEHWSTDMAMTNDTERESMGLLPFVSREDWNATSGGKTFNRLNGSVEYVFVGEVGDRCFTHTQCIREIQSQQARSLKLYGNVPDHFYIGDDGNAYEGLGWQKDTFQNTTDMQAKSLFVRFYGRYDNDVPSKYALAAFHRLMIYGLNTKLLSDNYKIISIRQLCNCSDGLGDVFQGALEKWERYLYNPIPFAFTETAPYLPLKVIPLRRINSNDEVPIMDENILLPAEYVIVLNGGERCFERQQCDTELINAASKTTRNTVNFFVGDDGLLYEGSGWGNNPVWKHICQNCSLLTVHFFGNFSYDLPSESAERAFNFLVNWGVLVGKISPEYKLLSIRQICNDYTLVGDALNLQIRKWKNWSDEISKAFDCSYLNGKVISRDTWGVISSIRGQYQYKPVGFIFVRNGRERCYSKQECLDRMIQEDTQVQRHYGVLENFYVGDDGNVYEGRGWHRTPEHVFHGQYSSEYHGHNLPYASRSVSINVLFFGNFEDVMPSQNAIFAFKNLIVKQGIKSGNLHPSFKIHAVPYGTYSINVGTMLTENINILY